MSNKKLKIAIIIINYNGTEDTIQCLLSIDSYLSPTDDVAEYYVALLDNASTKSFPVEFLNGLKHRIFFYKSNENLGFAGGNNLAIKLISEDIENIDYYMLLNNDTVIVDNSISKLVKATKDSDFAITGIINYYYDKPDKCWQAGSTLRPKCIKGKSIHPESTTTTFFTEVESIPGSSFLIKKSVTDIIGLLDERYFAYYEELELCERARRANFRIAFLNGTRLLHKVGRASSSYYKHYLRTRNTLLLFSEYYPSMMIMAKLRILFRTIACQLRTGKVIKYYRAYHSGIKDFNNKKFGK